MSFPSLFPLGAVGFTSGVQAASEAGKISRARLISLLLQHGSCNWGLLDEDDRATNDAALRQGGRLLSAYAMDPNQPSSGIGENSIWIITEADRSVTTFLLPDEY